jgi:hypothetical protein
MILIKGIKIFLKGMVEISLLQLCQTMQARVHG